MMEVVGFLVTFFFVLQHVHLIFQDMPRISAW